MSHSRHHKTEIGKLIDRSSLGTPDARRAWSRVTVNAARAVVERAAKTPRIIKGGRPSGD